MALFSDLDWLIIAGVGAFLLLGKENGAVLRQVGRYYGRLMRLKQELLADVAKAADLPAPTAGRPTTVRGALVDFVDPPAGRTSGIPVYVSVPPAVAVGAFAASAGAGWGSGTWSLARPGDGIAGEAGPR